MATINAIGTTNPIGVVNGGTAASSFSTSNGIVKYTGSALASSSTFTCDANNYVTNSSQPLVFAYLSTSISNATGDGTNAVIICNSTSVNQSSSYNTSTGVFTAPKAGRYLLQGSIGLGPLGMTHTSGILNIQFTSLSYQTNALNYFSIRDGNSNVVMCFNAQENMNASDQLIIGQQVQGSSKTVAILGGSTAVTYFAIYLLSA